MGKHCRSVVDNLDNSEEWTVDPVDSSELSEVATSIGKEAKMDAAVGPGSFLPGFSPYVCPRTVILCGCQLQWGDLGWRGGQRQPSCP